MLSFVWSIAVGAVSVQLFYYLFFYVKIFQITETKTPRHTQPPVSVIVCAWNELENLSKNLPHILQQDYPCFEVIVVDDCSTDQTWQWLESQQDSRLKIVRRAAGANSPNKKQAIHAAVATAQHNVLIFTDADCRPATYRWLQAMSEPFVRGKEIAIGYGAYSTVPDNKFVNKLIRFETAFIALQYSTFALAGCAYMGTGRNMAYTKALFERSGGLAAHRHIRSGDDDLFVNQNARNRNYNIVLQADSFTYSEPKHSFGEWVRQKRRHVSTAQYYKWPHKILLSGEPGSRILMHIGVLCAIAAAGNGIQVCLPFAILLALRYFIFIVVSRKTFVVLCEKRILPWAIIFDTIFPYLYLSTMAQNIISPKTNSWN